jgi:hypothetical protein
VPAHDEGADGRVGGGKEFAFEPRSITAIGDDCVIAEGWEGAQAYWVHVWSVKDNAVPGVF